MNNKQTFLDLVETKIKPGIPEVEKLLEYLNTTDFFVAPASTKYHLAHEGGLIEHSLSVYHTLDALISAYKLDLDKLGINSYELCFCALFHDICKCNMYVKSTRNVKEYHDMGKSNDNKGRFDWVEETYYTIDEQLVMGHGEKSLYLINKFVSTLSLDAEQAIRWHMGAFSIPGTNFADPQAGKAFSQCSFAVLLHIADLMSTYLFEN